MKFHNRGERHFGDLLTLFMPKIERITENNESVELEVILCDIKYGKTLILRCILTAKTLFHQVCLQLCVD